jgi:hypothetical protein
LPVYPENLLVGNYSFSYRVIVNFKISGLFSVSGGESRSPSLIWQRVYLIVRGILPQSGGLSDIPFPEVFP